MRGCRLGESLPSSVGPFDCPVSATPEALTAPFSHLVQRVPLAPPPSPSEHWADPQSGGDTGAGESSAPGPSTEPAQRLRALNRRVGVGAPSRGVLPHSSEAGVPALPSRWSLGPLVSPSGFPVFPASHVCSCGVSDLTLPGTRS